MFVLLFYALMKYRGDIVIYDVMRDLKDKFDLLNVLKMADKVGRDGSHRAAV